MGDIVIFFSPIFFRYGGGSRNAILGRVLSLMRKNCTLLYYSAYIITSDKIPKQTQSTVTLFILSLSIRRRHVHDTYNKYMEPIKHASEIIIKFQVILPIYTLVSGEEGPCWNVMTPTTRGIGIILWMAFKLQDKKKLQGAEHNQKCLNIQGSYK